MFEGLKQVFSVGQSTTSEENLQHSGGKVVELSHAGPDGKQMSSKVVVSNGVLSSEAVQPSAIPVLEPAQSSNQFKYELPPASVEAKVIVANGANADGTTIPSVESVIVSDGLKPAEPVVEVQKNRERQAWPDDEVQRIKQQTEKLKECRKKVDDQYLTADDLQFIEAMYQRYLDLEANKTKNSLAIFELKFMRARIQALHAYAQDAQKWNWRWVKDGGLKGISDEESQLIQKRRIDRLKSVLKDRLKAEYTEEKWTVIETRLTEDTLAFADSSKDITAARTALKRLLKAAGVAEGEAILAISQSYFDRKNNKYREGIQPREDVGVEQNTVGSDPDVLDTQGAVETPSAPTPVEVETVDQSDPLSAEPEKQPESLGSTPEDAEGEEPSEAARMQEIYTAIDAAAGLTQENSSTDLSATLTLDEVGKAPATQKEVVADLIDDLGYEVDPIITDDPIGTRIYLSRSQPSGLSFSLESYKGSNIAERAPGEWYLSYEENGTAKDYLLSSAQKGKIDAVIKEYDERKNIPPQPAETVESRPSGDMRKELSDMLRSRDMRGLFGLNSEMDRTTVVGKMMPFLVGVTAENALDRRFEAWKMLVKEALITPKSNDRVKIAQQNEFFDRVFGSETGKHAVIDETGVVPVLRKEKEDGYSRERVPMLGRFERLKANILGMFTNQGVPQVKELSFNESIVGKGLLPVAEQTKEPNSNTEKRRINSLKRILIALAVAALAGTAIHSVTSDDNETTAAASSGAPSPSLDRDLSIGGIPDVPSDLLSSTPGPQPIATETPTLGVASTSAVTERAVTEYLEANPDQVGSLSAMPGLGEFAENVQKFISKSLPVSIEKNADGSSTLSAGDSSLEIPAQLTQAYLEIVENVSSAPDEAVENQNSGIENEQVVPFEKVKFEDASTWHHVKRVLTEYLDKNEWKLGEIPIVNVDFPEQLGGDQRIETDVPLGQTVDLGKDVTVLLNWIKANLLNDYFNPDSIGTELKEAAVLPDNINTQAELEAFLVSTGNLPVVMSDKQIINLARFSAEALITPADERDILEGKFIEYYNSNTAYEGPGNIVNAKRLWSAVPETALEFVALANGLPVEEDQLAQAETLPQSKIDQIAQEVVAGVNQSTQQEADAPVASEESERPIATPEEGQDAVKPVHALIELGGPVTQEKLSIIAENLKGKLGVSEVVPDQNLEGFTPARIALWTGLTGEITAKESKLLRAILDKVEKTDLAQLDTETDGVIGSWNRELALDFPEVMSALISYFKVRDNFTQIASDMGYFLQGENLDRAGINAGDVARTLGFVDENNVPKDLYMWLSAFEASDDNNKRELLKQFSAVTDSTITDFIASLSSNN